MTALPGLPSQSLYGKFPAFPTYNFKAGWTILGHFYGISVRIPNISQIPNWIFEVIQWIIGWIGAYYEFAFKYLSVEFTNVGNAIISKLTEAESTLINISETASQKTGIAEPLIFSLFAGVILFGMVLIIILAVNAITKVL